MHFAWESASPAVHNNLHLSIFATLAAAFRAQSLVRLSVRCSRASGCAIPRLHECLLARSRAI